MQASNQQQRMANWLGYLGIIPFLFCAINLLIDWPLFNGFALQVFVIYSAVILSYLGGIRWGLALAQPSTSQWSLVLAVLPSFAALGSLLLATPIMQLSALMIFFAAQGLLDQLYPATGMPSWMIKLRLRLTLLVIATHVLAIIALNSLY